MIDFDNLRTASLYINNQLLSRGLLRDGRGIDFADPGDTDYDLADTMGRIIGVVNDLILRRDRDAEHRESLSTTLRTLRADSLRQSDNFSRLQEKYTEAQRKISLHEAEENAIRDQLKAAESTVQKLKEEAARAKRLVAETRASCANEVRKRDRQIDGLKKAAADAGRARGERKAPGITSIQVVGEVGAEEEVIAPGASTADENYDLRQETNTFLAQLAKGLNEENETLLALLRKTGDNLKEMSGWEKTEAAAAASKRDAHVVTLVASPEDISADIHAVLDHLRTMLTNPSFVPLEEVVVREQEIFRLRDGWEKMETRWRETVHLIDGWHRRMAANGRPIDMEDLKMGLRLSPIKVRGVGRFRRKHATFGLTTLHEEEEGEDVNDIEEEDGQVEEGVDLAQKPGSPSPAGSLHLVPAPGYDETPDYEGGPEEIDDSDAESSIFDEDVENDLDMDELEAPEPNVEILQQSTEDSTSMPVPPGRKAAPLEESNAAGNRKTTARAMVNPRKRSGELMAGNTSEGDEAPPPPPHGTKKGHPPAKRLKVSAESQEEKPDSRPDAAAATNLDSSLESAKPSPETSVPKISSNTTTTKPTRSDALIKRDTVAMRKTATRPTRAALAKSTEQPKKEIPMTRPLARQRPTRATAATSSSSARTGAPKPTESSKPRAPPASVTSTDMPPPPRSNKSANASPSNDKSQHPPPPPPPPPPPAQEDKNKASPANQRPPPTNSTTVQAEPATSSTSPGLKRPAPPPAATAPDSPTRSPGRAASRLPLPRTAGTTGALPPPQQSPLSMARIAAKLAASEREADAARVKAKLRAARLSRSKGVSSPTATNHGPVAQQVSATSTAVPGGAGAGAGAGDPIKRDNKRVSGPSAPAEGTTGFGASHSTDDNGQKGSAPVSEDHVTSSGAAPAPATSTTADDEAHFVMSGANGDGDGDGDGNGGKQAPRRAKASSPRKASPTTTTKASSSPAKERPRRREVRSRADRVASRRRSTLNPWELQSLISGEVVPPSPREAAPATAERG